MSTDSTISKPGYTQRFFAFAIVTCRRTGKLRDVLRSRRDQKLADVFFIVTITLSLLGYVSGAVAKRCPQNLGRICCVERNTQFCEECSVQVEDCFPPAAFAFGRSEISAEDRERLAEAAALMKRLPSDTVIEIAGHTDNTGGRTANLKLSGQRAEAVRDELIRLGVPAGMLKTKAYGESRPFRSNDTPMGRLRNRSVSYSVVSPD